MMLLAEPRYIQPVFFIVGMMMSFCFLISAFFAWKFFQSTIPKCITHGGMRLPTIRVFRSPLFYGFSTYFTTAPFCKPTSVITLTFWRMSIFMTFSQITFFASGKWNSIILMPIEIFERFYNVT